MHQLAVTMEAAMVDHVVNDLDERFRLVLRSLRYLQELPLAHAVSEIDLFAVDILIGTASIGQSYWINRSEDLDQQPSTYDLDT